MITITPEAYTKLREIMIQENKADWNLRMGVQASDCCGQHYMFGLDQKIHEDDQVFKHEDLTIVCDNQSLPFLDGAEVMWETGEQGEGFLINNPNNACGSCGEGSGCGDGGHCG
jgi:iron-sulfur cluster assembly accessory protein